MKTKIFLLFLGASIMTGCSKEDNEEEEGTLETFIVKYEIKGYGEVPKIMYTTNEGRFEMENDEDDPAGDVSGVTLPFVTEFVYTTKIDGEETPEGNTLHGCAGVSISAYADSSDGRIEEMNVYINGKLEDSEIEGYYYVPGEHWTPWGSVSYSYLRRGAEEGKYTCN